MSAPRGRLVSGDPLLEVHGLRITAEAEGRPKTITVATDLTVAPGETVGIVGESGSGKSLTARAILRLLPPGVEASGRVVYRGTDLLAASEGTMREVRGRRVSLMFQDPYSMLNPLMRCGKHIEEMLQDERGRRLSKVRREEETLRRLAEVGIGDASVAGLYPFQLSGGMRQRVALAAALARDPDLLIADEPSTALDVTTQAEILELLRSVQQRRGMGLVLITHDLRVAFSTCDRIYVLYAGSLVEVGSAADLEREPLHPYSLGLLLSEPPVERRMPELVAIRGRVPSADEVAGTCAFAPRCSWAADVCVEGRPELRRVDGIRLTSCVRMEEIRGEMARLREQALGSDGAEEGAIAIREPILSVQGLVKVFQTGRRSAVEALKGVSLEIGAGESVGLVGESGSGKTTLGRCLVGLETPTSGSIDIEGIDVSDFGALSEPHRAAIRRTIQMVFQDPYSTLNPRHSVGRSLQEALRARPVESDARPPRVTVDELLERVGLPASYASRRPAGLSGGERQRVAIARALAVDPQILVCDEPVSALDVSVQAQILNLFQSLQRELGVSYLFITHDLAVVRQVAARLYVLYRGEVVEQGLADEVLGSPKHWYTRRLIDSIPRSEREHR